MLFASLVHPIRFPLDPVRLLSLLLPIIVVTALPAQAAENALDTPAAARKHYDIPAGPLGRALSHFATVAGIALSFDPVLTEGLTSPALTGNFSVGKGFNRLLADSGLELMRNADSSYTLRQAPIKATQAGVTALPVVTVSTSTENADDTGYVTQRSSSSTKTDTPLIEVPQSISVITRRELDARLVQNISQAVSYTPGVLTEMYGPVMRDDYFNIRGFDAPQFLDGLGLWGVNYANLRIEPYGMESIEVLKGPSSTL
ncbi:MAG: TonB-dependent siderophore receptor, partial [Nitrosomonas sp. PRO5]|nr:TonB-dependent siderophore receptor [Nitrosomonas sp. PRO5]